MTIEEVKDYTKKLSSKVEQAIDSLNLEDKNKILAELKEKMMASDFWDDQNQAREVSSKASHLENKIVSWQALRQRVKDLENVLDEEQAEDLLPDLENDFVHLNQEYQELSTELYLQGEYDDRSAIVSIYSGAGGVDAQDWTSMLERMFLRFAEQNDWKVSFLSRSEGSEAGLKSSTFKVSGVYAYGYLKNEAGVHRLVRLSPFDGDHARHTSFAMVEVLPELADIDLEIKEEDLKVDTYRASGHGGQSVNTTDSAVRITHLPTGIVATCQNERSQLQNKRQALSHLASKIYKYYQVEKEEEKKAIRGEFTEAAWGNQIRSYVLHPYKMVKDHRTDFQVSDPDKVLDGDLMPFIKSNLEKNVA